MAISRDRPVRRRLMSSIPKLLRLSERTAILPVIHGSGDCAIAVRRWMLEHQFDCVAIPLPESFRQPLESAVSQLPSPSIIIQPPSNRFHADDDPEYPFWKKDWGETPWSPSDKGHNETDGPDPSAIDDDDAVDESDLPPCSYVPVDPCQPVIMAIRAALGEHLPRAYIDLETSPFQPQSAVMPDSYALKHVTVQRFAAAMLPSIPRPPDEQTRTRLQYMAFRLHQLEQRHHRILFVCNVLHWPWVCEAYLAPPETPPEPDAVEPAIAYDVAPRTLTFLFGELPFITGLYERARAALEDDENLSIDGVKELLLASRDAYRLELGNRARPITPMLLSQCSKYIRNLALIERRFTPDLYTIVTAAKQVLGDAFAMHVVEAACRYLDLPDSDQQTVSLGIDECRFPDGEVRDLVSRLPGTSVSWKSVQLQKRPDRADTKRWQSTWVPTGQCSYPPEDVQIESLRARVFDRAQTIIGTDLVRTEKFTTSVKDGIDIRDTLRHWYDKQIYVRVLPPAQAQLDACVMLFDSPADPRDYPWRTTWFSEHSEESTMAFFASDFRQQMVGPGIALAVYGGALFLFPPIIIPDIWDDRRLDFVDSLEERLIAAACIYARGRHVALFSTLPPGAGWRRLARRLKKHLVHVPLRGFSSAEVQQMRHVHVLNGTHVRSYAADFIRKA